MPRSKQKTPAPGQEAVAFATCLADLGISHLVVLPDNTSAPLLAAVGSKEETELLFGTREGEVISLASGLWLGGASPSVLIQNTGLLEAGDALRGTASRMGAPILLLVTCRGYAKSRAVGKAPQEVQMSRDVLVRPDLDSIAHMTESTLRAWGIPFGYLRDPSDLSPIRDGWARAQEEERPVAVLIDATFP